MKPIVVTQSIVPKTTARPKAIRFASLLFLAALVCCASLAFVTRARSAKMPAPKAPAVVAPEATTQDGESKRGPVQVVRFTLYDVGIYPYEAHVGEGLVAVLFEDLSGGAGDVVVTRETGAAPAFMGRVQHADQNPRGRADLKLATGRYQVYVADHPENRATLIVD